MSMFEEVGKLEDYVIDLELHIEHLQRWYTDKEHKDLKVNRALLESVKEELRALVSECKVKHDNGTCDDSFRICMSCDSLIGDGHVLIDETYCSDCFHEQCEELGVEKLFESGEAYWTSWY